MRCTCLLQATVAALAVAGLFAHEGHGKKNAPAAAKTLKSPLAASPSVLEAGKSAYERVCANCHGPDGRAKTAVTKVKPTNLADHRMDTMKDGEIYWVVTHGIGKAMPAFKTQLSEVERWQVVAYVRELRRRQAAEEGKAHH
jgi:mono/diheme cytochrome c family protein